MEPNQERSRCGVQALLHRHTRYRPCPGCTPAREARRRAKLTERISAECGLSPGQRAFEFEQFQVYAGNEQAYQAAREFAEVGVAERRWLGIQGPSGNGKTFLLGCIANAAIARGIPTIYAFVPRLLDHVRAGYNRDEDDRAGFGQYDERWARVLGVELLLLDDLGTQRDSEWTKEQLLTLVNHRHDHRLATAYTTNVAIPDLRDAWDGIAGERLYSRLLRYQPSLIVANTAKPYHEWPGRRRRREAAL